MIRKTLFIPLVVLSIVTVGCGKKSEQVATSATSETMVTESSASVTTTAAAASTSPPATSAQSSPTPAATSAPAAPAAALSSQETNWTGVTAEVTEFKRKGNTLTAKVRFRNSGTETMEPDIRLRDTYVMDSSAGKKYEVLKDEKGTYIAALHPGYSDRWYTNVKAGEQATIWMKFPAPPAEVKAVTLQLPGVPPFEDVPIQD